MNPTLLTAAKAAGVGHARLLAGEIGTWGKP